MKAAAFGFPAVLALAVCACGRPQPITLGFVGTLTGPGSELSVVARNTVQLAVDLQNRAGGVRERPLRLAVRDDLGDNAEAVRVDRELAEKEKAPAVIGHITSHLSPAALTVAASGEVLLISPSMGSPNLSGRDDFFIRTVADSSATQGRGLAERLVRDGVGRTAFVSSVLNHDFTLAVGAAFRDRFGELGGGLFSPLVHTGAKSNPELVETIRQIRPEAVVCAMSALDAAGLAQLLRKAGYAGRLFGIPLTMTEDLPREGGSAVEGMLFINYELGGESAAVRRLHSQYEQSYGSRPSFIAALAWDAAMVLFDALKNCREPIGPASLRQYILDKREFRGLERDLAIDRFGDSSDRPYSYFILKNGSFVRSP